MRMNDLKTVDRPDRFARAAATAAALALLAVAFASAATAEPARPRAGDLAMPAEAGQAAGPLEIRNVELSDGVSGHRLEIATSGPMVWTSYRDSDGDLVIELPNSVPSAALAGLNLSDELIESARLETRESGDRPMTQLVVRTHDAAEHSVSADGSRLMVDLIPLEADPVKQVPAAPVAEPQTAEMSYAAVEPNVTFEPQDSPAVIELDTPRPGPAPTGEAATQLYGVDVATSDDSTTVWIQGDGGFYYSTLSLDDPYRFVIDLMGVANTSTVSNLTVAAALVDGVRVAQFQSQPEMVARVVVDLFEQAVPKIEAVADGLKLVFGTADPVAVMPSPVSDISEAVEEEAAEEQPANEPLPQEENLAAGVVEEDLAEPIADEAEEAEEAVTEELPDPVQEALDEALDETPVEEPAAPPAEEPVYESTVAANNEAENYGAPVAVAQIAQVTEDPPALPEPDLPEPAAEPEPEPMGPTDASLFDLAEISVDDPPADGQPSLSGGDFGTRDVTFGPAQVEYQGEPITMTLRDADVKDVLRSFAQFAGLNVVIQPGVEGEVTVELTDVPWDQALELILRINDLDFQLEGNIMRVASSEQFRREAEERARAEAAKALAIPLKTVMQRVSYATASDIASVLASGQGGVMTSRGSILVDARTNTLIIKELPDNIDTVLAVIETLDIPEPQVMIEARIIETTKRFSRTLGIQWAFNGLADAEHGNTTGLEFPNNIDATGGVSLLTGGSNGFLDISLGNVLNTFTLDAALTAAENEGLINILSAPKIATLNNHSASIQSGLQIPIQTIANNTVSVQFVNATLRLDVTPHVTAEGTVLMDINIQKREPQLAFAVAGAANAPIATRDAATRVIVRDGGTAVIGGIYEVSSDQGEDRVPGLSNIPLIRHLFKNKRRTDENEELLIFITPRIVRL